VTPQEAIDFVLERLEAPATEICKNLTDLVAKKAKTARFDDNATVLLVKLKGDNCTREKPEGNEISLELINGL
jgi:hypothetical protein